MGIRSSPYGGRMSETVVPLHACKPNTKVYYHEGFRIVATFDLGTRKWTWVATKPVVSKIEYSGEAKTPGYALSMAKRRIDNG
jgi:hypothetical protein